MTIAETPAAFERIVRFAELDARTQGVVAVPGDEEYDAWRRFYAAFVALQVFALPKLGVTFDFTTKVEHVVKHAELFPELVLIDEALLRLEDEEYGECQNCEEKINPKRLAAIPWARYCLNCQELLEKGLLEDE